MKPTTDDPRFPPGSEVRTAAAFRRALQIRGLLRLDAPLDQKYQIQREFLAAELDSGRAIANLPAGALFADAEWRRRLGL